jgi:hypothetical protein
MCLLRLSGTDKITDLFLLFFLLWVQILSGLSDSFMLGSFIKQKIIETYNVIKDKKNNLKTYKRINFKKGQNDGEG